MIGIPPISMGLMSGHTYLTDPRRLTFTFSRYKFASKMLSGADSVLEIGCAEAFGSALVQKEVDCLLAADFDPTSIANATKFHPHARSTEFRVDNFLAAPVREDFDAAYALDVLEHISRADKRVFMRNLVDSLALTGVGIIGMPSLESQVYASELS